ncbi:MAG: hypothetical protein A2252_04725 [Elusimicrobia bacterium RIFOXYA2_FULL_39_19]|nr:MAG: hypothetical protein A2252_04725 [Elusimicrobia bacterium RIFOXYA2_FULL_39_19]
MEKYLTDQEKSYAKNLLKRIDFMSGLPDPDIDFLVGTLEKNAYKPNQTIVFQGEISSKLYVVCDGMVSIIVRSGQDKKKVAELKTGDYFGEISLIEPTTASATVKAEQPTIVCAITCENFKRILEKNSNALEALKNKIAARKEASKSK